MTAVVETKKCPRCQGTGRVPRNRHHEEMVERSREWAMQYHGQVVKASLPGGGLVGVGVARAGQGGYWRVFVYTPGHVWGKSMVPVTRETAGEPFPYREFSRNWGADKLQVVPVWDVHEETISTLRPIGIALQGPQGGTNT